MKFFLSTFFILSLLCTIGSSKTAEEWRTRSVYQIITDRFAKTKGDAEACNDLYNYCGGTFKGIETNLDYIQGMGFNAIWISPVVENTENGYHGYWIKNLYEINPHFGTRQEFHELIEACHQRDIWVMVDVVANHIGYVPYINEAENTRNYSEIIPFNKDSHFNKFRHCDDADFGSQEQVETCWLNGLPDLDQSNPEVKELLMSWAADFVKQYNIDAFRIDTVPHVSKSFWAEFSQRAGVYTIGEILNFDLNYLAGYQGPIDGVLNYALYSTMRYAFQDGGSMNSIQEYFNVAYDRWPDISVLGNFVDNHDNPRFLSKNGNQQTFKSALAFSLTTIGIPMVYYGDEQAYAGGADPMNRESLWTNLNTESEIYKHLATINGFRSQTEFYKYDQVQRYSDNNFYAFTRGENFFAFTNTNDYQQRTITYHNYADGTVLCNIFHKGDCVEVNNGAFPVVLINGEVKIFAPKTSEPEPVVERSSIADKLKIGMGIGSMYGSIDLGSSWRMG